MKTPEMTVHAGFEPLARLLQGATPGKLAAARERVGEFSRNELQARFLAANRDKRRLTAFLLAEEFTARGIPPAFRGLTAPERDTDVNLRFDALIFDLRWIRRHYPEHAAVIRYRRCRQLIHAGDAAFHREAEYTFNRGLRPLWKIVASLSLTERQQWDCLMLRSAPLVKRHHKILEASDEVYRALESHMQSVRRTKAYCDDAAEATLLRRHALWFCSQMTGRSPSEIASRYLQLTGYQITRQAAAKQLAKTLAVLRKVEMKTPREQR